MLLWNGRMALGGWYMEALVWLLIFLLPVFVAYHTKLHNFRSCVFCPNILWLLVNLSDVATVSCSLGCSIGLAMGTCSLAQLHLAKIWLNQTVHATKLYQKGTIRYNEHYSEMQNYYYLKSSGHIKFYIMKLTFLLEHQHHLR